MPENSRRRRAGSLDEATKEHALLFSSSLLLRFSEVPPASRWQISILSLLLPLGPPDLPAPHAFFSGGVKGRKGGRVPFESLGSIRSKTIPRPVPPTPTLRIPLVLVLVILLTFSETCACPLLRPFHLPLDYYPPFPTSLCDSPSPPPPPPIPRINQYISPRPPSPSSPSAPSSSLSLSSTFIFHLHLSGPISWSLAQYLSLRYTGVYPQHQHQPRLFNRCLLPRHHHPHRHHHRSCTRRRSTSRPSRKRSSPFRMRFKRSGHRRHSMKNWTTTRKGF